MHAHGTPKRLDFNPKEDNELSEIEGILSIDDLDNDDALIGQSPRPSTPLPGRNQPEEDKNQNPDPLITYVPNDNPPPPKLGNPKPGALVAPRPIRRSPQNLYDEINDPKGLLSRAQRRYSALLKHSHFHLQAAPQYSIFDINAPKKTFQPSSHRIDTTLKSLKLREEKDAPKATLEALEKQLNISR